MYFENTKMYCKKPVHYVSNCLFLKSKHSVVKRTGITSLRSCIEPDSLDKVEKPYSVAKVTEPYSTFWVSGPKTDSVMEIYEPFLSKGFVSLTGDTCTSTLLLY